MLLIERAGISQNELMTVAEWYRLGNEVSTMYQACQNGIDATTGADVIQLPGQAEYQSLRDQYDIE